VLFPSDSLFFLFASDHVTFWGVVEKRTDVGSALTNFAIFSHIGVEFYNWSQICFQAHSARIITPYFCFRPGHGSWMQEATVFRIDINNKKQIIVSKDAL